MILGQNNSNIPRIIAIFAEAFSVEALPTTNEVHKRMVNITRQVQVSVLKVFRSDLYISVHNRRLDIQDDLRIILIF